MRLVSNVKLRQRTAERRRPRSRSLGGRSWLAAIGVLGLFCSSATAGAGAGAVSGLVLDDSGRPVAAARVLIAHAAVAGAPALPAPPVVTGALATVLVADTTGSFHAAGLAAGQYVACAENTSQGLLDPCHWAASAPSFTVTSGQTTAGVDVVMAKGAVVRVHVNDPLTLLSQVSGPVDLNLEIHLVTTRGLHYTAFIQSSTASGRDYAITVPFAAALTLRVLSAHLIVNDQSGTAVSPAGTVVNVPVGSTPAVMELTVAGSK